MAALTDKYCIVGVGETPHMRPSNRTTFSMGVEAIKNAVADAGMHPSEIDGMTSYQVMDSTGAQTLAGALGMRLNYALDIIGGGSSTEALIAHAIGLLEGGYCKNIVLFRSMNGRSGMRMGGQAVGGPQPATPVAGQGAWNTGNGWTTPAQMFGMACMRYFSEFGYNTDSLAEVAVAHRYHATLNPKSLMKSPITIEDHHKSRWVSKPFRLLDCCLETDVAIAMVITSRERAYDCKHPPVFISGGIARTNVPNAHWNWSRPDVWYVAGNYGRNRLFGTAGVSQKDIDIISCYDAFTFTTMIQLEAYGFCGRGEAGEFVKGQRLRIDHELPCNLSGGHLSEGYTHGMNMVTENVRQLRHRVDDFCPGWAEGKHTYDRTKGCRQARNARLATCMGWAEPGCGSAVILKGIAGQGRSQGV